MKNSEVLAAAQTVLEKTDANAMQRHVDTEATQIPVLEAQARELLNLEAQDEIYTEDSDVFVAIIVSSLFV